MFMSIPSRYAAHREWKKGLAAAAAQEFDGAAAAFNACLSARPGDADCRAGLAMASHINASWTRFDRIAAPERAVPEPAGPGAAVAAGYLKEAVEHIKRGEQAEALEAFRRCLAIDPTLTACEIGGKVYARGAAPIVPPAGALSGAPPTEDDKRRAVVHWNEGIKAFQKGDATAARDEWLLCSKFDSGNSDCAQGLARLDSAYGGGR